MTATLEVHRHGLDDKTRKRLKERGFKYYRQFGFWVHADEDETWFHYHGADIEVERYSNLGKDIYDFYKNGD